MRGEMEQDFEKDDMKCFRISVKMKSFVLRPNLFGKFELSR